MAAKKIIKKVTKVIVPKAPPQPKQETRYRYDLDGNEFSIVVDDSYEDNQFNAQLESTPHCCGVIEIGDINIEDYAITKEKNFKTCMDNAVTKLLQDDTKKNGVHTYIANLIDNPACNALRDSFIRTGLFTLVKTFKNYTGGVINMWISGN